MSKLVKLRPLIVKHNDGGGYTKIQWVKGIGSDAGPGYLRLEDDCGKYLGSLSNAQVKRLKEWFWRHP